MTFAFDHLNLTGNPFGEWEPEDRAAVAVVDRPSLLAAIRSQKHALQLIGDCGRGKTTHLLALMFAFQAEGDARSCIYHHIREDDIPRLPDLDRDLVMVDEIQRLRPRDRRKLFRCDRPIAVGTHVDYSRAMQRVGRIVTTVACGGELTPHELAALLNRRIAYCRRGEGKIPMISTATCGKLLRSYGDNLRAIEDHLYFVIQDLKEITDV